MRVVTFLCWLAFSMQAIPSAPEVARPLVVSAPRPTDTCPVCGMFVTKYPNWIATVVWRDGQAVHFDGAKDLFFYLHQLPKYARGRTAADITAIAVTEFYDLRRIDARQAFFVVGSDVLGPMGHEFIPFASRSDAHEFLKDHRGTRIVRFADITLQVVRQVDAAR